VAKKISVGIPYPCFFQFLTAVKYAPLSQFNIRITMENNTAPTGSALYGGSVDFCWSKSMLVDNRKVPFTYPEGKWIFDTIFEIKPSKANDTSVILSVALDVCFCENGYPQCDLRTKNVTIICWRNTKHISGNCWPEKWNSIGQYCHLKLWISSSGTRLP